MNMKRILVVLVVLSASTVALAQSAAPPPHHDPFGRYFFPPELVMGHQSEIGLDDEQREAIKDVVKEAETTFLDFKWELHAETEKLVALLEPARIDAGAVLAQAEVVMNLEKEIKKTHIALLVGIKNALTETQQEQLREIRRRMTPPAPPAPPTRPSSMVRPPAPEAAPVPPASPEPATPATTAR